MSNKSLFARNLTYLRLRKKLTIREAAHLAGIHHKSWGAYEEGRASPNIQALPQISEALSHRDILSMLTQDLSVDPIPVSDAETMALQLKNDIIRQVESLARIIK